MKATRWLFLLLTLPLTGCVTTASMYVEQGLPLESSDHVESIARAESDTRARIQIDMKKEWK